MILDINSVKSLIKDDYHCSDSKLGYGKGAINKPFNIITGALTHHNMAYGSTAEAVAKAVHDGGIARQEQGIAHAYIGADGIYTLINQSTIPYAVGYYNANIDNYSIEIIDKGADIKKAEEIACAYTAYICKKNNVKFNQLNNMLHSEYTATACPWKLVEEYGSVAKAKAHMKSRVEFYEKGGKMNLNTMKEVKASTSEKWNEHGFKNKHGKHYFAYSVNDKVRFTKTTFKKADIPYMDEQICINDDKEIHLLTAKMDTPTYSDIAATKKDGTIKKGQKIISQHVRSFTKK